MNTLLVILVIGVVLIGSAFLLFQATNVQQGTATGLAAGSTASQQPSSPGSSGSVTQQYPNMVGGC